MLSSTILFSVDVRSKIRCVFELIFNFEKRDHYQRDSTQLLEVRKNCFLMQKGRYSFFREMRLYNVVALC